MNCGLLCLICSPPACHGTKQNTIWSGIGRKLGSYKRISDRISNSGCLPAHNNAAWLCSYCFAACCLQARWNLVTEVELSKTLFSPLNYNIKYFIHYDVYFIAEKCLMLVDSCTWQEADKQTQASKSVRTIIRINFIWITTDRIWVFASFLIYKICTFIHVIRLIFACENDRKCTQMLRRVDVSLRQVGHFADSWGMTSVSP